MTGAGDAWTGGGDPVRAQDRRDLSRDPGVACRGRVQTVVGVLELPLPGERVHDDHVRVGALAAVTIDVVRPVERGPGSGGPGW